MPKNGYFSPANGMHPAALATIQSTVFCWPSMSRRDDNIQMYWPHALATLLFAIALARYMWIGRYESLARSMAAAFFGFVCVVASHEVADWTGWFRW